jgi:UDP-N-acetyl-alpha-D-muramoyl-L-alanyl-L-glutamate epimerase
MSKYQQFIFDAYLFNKETGELELRYSLDDALHFTEKYRFDFPFTAYNPAVLDRAVQALFFMAGVSYYKTYIPPEIIIRQGELDASMAAFLSKTYQRGLGEFWYVNQLDPHTPVTFPVTTKESLQPATNSGSGQLIGVGGGKDSLVSIELLRKEKADIATWSLDHHAQLTPLVERIGLPHYWVERAWDPQLLTLKEQDAYNGHIPISAIFGCVGAIVAILAGKRDVVVSNEHSANEPTLHYQGVAINHQYSKSQEFEEDFQQYLAHVFGDSLRYYSLLRPFTEIRIGELFARIGFDKYKDVFSSCNRAYVHGSDHMSWCGECPKCAFIFMALTPFISRKELEQLWGGKNLLLDPSLETMYRQLLGIQGDKPLECIGEIKESRASMRLAQKQYPELRDKYQFELPDEYDFRAFSPHSMPADIYQLFRQAMQEFQLSAGQPG